jgi:hypothetical protein
MESHRRQESSTKMPARKQRQLDEEIMSAWRHAAEDLGIRVEIPFTLANEDGETERYEGRVIDFGGPNGAVFGLLTDRSPSWKRAKRPVITGQI